MNVRKDDIESLRRALERELSELSTSSESAIQDRGIVELDQQAVGRLSRMDAMQRQAMARASDLRRAERRRRIEAALRRMEEGEYGYCLTCGDKIDAARLALDPSLPTCVSCARS